MLEKKVLVPVLLPRLCHSLISNFTLGHLMAPLKSSLEFDRISVGPLSNAELSLKTISSKHVGIEWWRSRLSGLFAKWKTSESSYIA
jgi:hypothetical protein